MISIIFFVLLCIGVYKLNDITQLHPKWTGIIPFYNSYLVYEYAQSTNIFWITLLLSLAYSFFSNTAYFIFAVILYVIKLIVS